MVILLCAKKFSLNCLNSRKLIRSGPLFVEMNFDIHAAKADLSELIFLNIGSSSVS
jgi:hypothetical protein